MQSFLHRDQLKRVNVVGTSGSGKSTFSKKLGSLLGMAVVEMDALFWEKNWTQASDDVFFERVRNATQNEEWILEGNFDRTLPIKWARVQTVIILDYIYPRTMCQLLKRTIFRAVTQRELWPGSGCRETFQKSFMTKDSILLWAMQTYRSHRTRYLSRMDDPQFAHIQFIRLRSPNAARRFLASL